MSPRPATLVTGAAGFVALNVIEALLGDGEAVVAHDLRPLPESTRRRWRSLPGELHVAVGDVRDLAAVAHAFALAPVECVIPAAAVTLGPAARLVALEDAFDVNVGGTATVLQHSLAHGVRRLVYVSSTAVYGEAPFADAAVDETCPVRPTGAYGYSKLAAERLVRRATATEGLDAVCARLTAAFGPWEHASGVRETLSPPLQLATAALAGAPVVLAPGGRRDWTSVSDLARALVALARAEAPASDLYNLGVGEVWHPELLCRALSEHFADFSWRVGAAPETTLDYNDPLDRTRRAIDSARLRAELDVGFTAPPPAAARYADWVAAHREWIAAPPGPRRGAAELTRPARRRPAGAP